MSTMHQLQLWLRDTGRYNGPIDGIYGRLTRAGVLMALEDGPDTQLTDDDFIASSRRLAVRPSVIHAFADVEACGAGFFAGKPKILFEPHVFSRLTKGQFDESNPTLSYPKWGTLPYPPTQDERYAQLLIAAGLEPYAAFCATSYGKFQILGENFGLCGFDSPWAFAASQAYDEVSQLKAFEQFITRSGLLQPLRAQMWTEVAKRYNGPAYLRNRYDVKLATAAREWDRKAEA